VLPTLLLFDVNDRSYPYKGLPLSQMAAVDEEELADHLL